MERQPAIGDYGVIGDGRSLALVSRGGSVDWYCVPRFDSPSIFGALLDPERGGRFVVRPLGPAEVTRRYIPRTNVLETTFETPTGRLQLTDLLSVSSEDEYRQALAPDHELLRRVACLAGEVEVEVLVDPRLDYGHASPHIRDRGDLGFFMGGTRNALALRADLPLRLQEEGGLYGRVRLRAGEVRWLSLVSDEYLPPVLEPLGEEAARRVARTVSWWSSWAGRCCYGGAHQEPVIRSALTLKLLAYPPSGAIVAAGTTSLPEEIGGERNWDYRYCWLRDASMTLHVLLDLGYTREGEAFLGWLLHATRRTRPEIRVLYDVFGSTNLPERTLDHLSGYRGSRPVRVGNDARDQFQLDAYGDVVSAAYEFVQRGGHLDPADQRLLVDLGKTVCRRWQEPDDGIWELRRERMQNTYSKAQCWLALDRLLRLEAQGHLRLGRLADRFRRNRSWIRRCVDTRGWNAGLRSHVAFLDGAELDASLLLLGVHGYEDPAGERMRGTRARIRAHLGADGAFLHRYRYEDGLPGLEGAFGICAFWDAELLALAGDLDEAEAVFDAARAAANDLGLLAEQYHVEQRELLGNFPQAFSHVGLVSAALALDAARGHPPQAPPAESTRAQRDQGSEDPG